MKYFLTSLIFGAFVIPSAVFAQNEDESSQQVTLSRDLKDFATISNIGGYFIGKYTYTDQDGKHGGDGFSQRMIRLYADGTILKDFKYRIQAQVNNSKFHMKDYYVEYAKYDEMRVRVGQYKRAFSFENPMNPWDVGTGDYSQLSKKLAGMGDYNGEDAIAGGRDQGLQIEGDLFPAKSDGHKYLHYQLQMMNGQGINVSDANGKRDFIGSLQVQPIKGLWLGLFGWTGNYTENNITVDRNRWGASMKYDYQGWTARAEYAHSQGHKISEYDDKRKAFSGTGKADAWYFTLGVPVNEWLKVYGKYDVYRDQATWGTMKTIYSIAPNFQIHKNLMLQLQYNSVHDKTAQNYVYNELWAEAYVRFDSNSVFKKK